MQQRREPRRHTGKDACSRSAAGPETDAFFSAVLERFRLQPPGEAKGEASRRRCDLNGDGICDAADRARFAASLGSCRGEANYNPLPDGDADGCVTEQDETSLFIADADGDEVPDDVDACPASNRSATVAIAGCESGVANRQLARGCTHTDEIAKCAATATNHGRFTSCVAKVGNALVSLGVITDAQQSAVQSCAARARIP